MHSGLAMHFVWVCLLPLAWPHQLVVGGGWKNSNTISTIIQAMWVRQGHAACKLYYQTAVVCPATAALPALVVPAHAALTRCGNRQEWFEVEGWRAVDGQAVVWRGVAV